ncbi:MAG: hypothetical protein PVF15_05960 [Candidatus Bathyarchaeota archaeon]
MTKLKHKLSLAIIMLSLQLLVFVSIVYAPWQTISTGYAIATNYHGIDILPGIPVTATAGTTDDSVTKVTFRWHRPPDGNGPIAWEVEVSPLSISPYPPPNVPQEVIDYANSTTIWYAQNTQVPDEIGDWGIQVFFQDSEGKDRAGVEDVVKIRAESVNVIPEIPFGTIGAAAAMIMALTLFALKKKKTLKIPRIL